MTTSKRDSHDKARRAGSQPNLGQKLTGENRGSGWIDTTGESVKRRDNTQAQQNTRLARKVWSMLLSARSQPNLALRKAKMSWQFTVGLRVKRNADRIVVDAEDALIAALKVKAERPEATILYVRRLNQRGDTRHPPHNLTEAVDRG